MPYGTFWREIDRPSPRANGGASGAGCPAPRGVTCTAEGRSGGGVGTGTAETVVGWRTESRMRSGSARREAAQRISPQSGFSNIVSYACGAPLVCPVTDP